jgi:tRNA-specific 2-thiouridylase
VAASRPLYALGSDAQTNTLVVGPRASLARTTIEAEGRLYLPVERADVKLRYRSESIPGGVECTGSGFIVRLDAPSYGVATGQAAVLYADDVVVGAGLIRASA